MTREPPTPAQDLAAWLAQGRVKDGQVADRVEKVLAELKAVRAALKPFAEYADGIEEFVPNDFVSRDGGARKIVVGDYRRARQALSGEA